MAKLKLQAGVEPGSYSGVVAGVEEQDGGKYGPAYRITYAIEGDREVSELVSAKYSPKSKMFARVTALLSSEAPDEIDPVDFIGKPVQITMVEKEDSEYSKVAAVRRRSDNEEGW
jgi:hypothetical protein